MQSEQQTSEQMHVFAMQSDPQDYVAARSLPEAIEFLAYFQDLNEEDIEVEGPHALSDAEMQSMSFIDEEGTLGKPGECYSFAEALKLMCKPGDLAPFYFACTEY